MKLAVVILAAGQGTRMRSSLPKALHPVAGRPMVYYILDTIAEVTAERPVLVVGYGAEQLRQAVGDRVVYVEQAEQLGTGHALLQARRLLEGRADTVLALYSDMPLLSSGTLRSLLQLHQEGQAPITMLTCRADDPMGFGRILRDGEGRVVGIVEEAVATEEQRRIKEINCGVYCFRADWLWLHLHKLPLSPKGEYYLTDLVAMAIGEGERVEALTAADPTEVLGINDRVHLARAEAIVRRRIREELMLSGVTIIDPPSTYIDALVHIGQDTTIHPHTHIQGDTRIGRDCLIGPNAIIRDSIIGNGCRILASVIEEAILEDEVSVGPFSHLRKGAHLAKGVHVGNFGEVKNSYLGPGTKMGHFSYVGDATVGREVNIGAGTVTCNYDGVAKYRTIIEDGAFIGSDTMLVAPVRIGAGAKIGAGSVVTHDIPPGSVAYGVPARVKGKVGEG